MKKQFARAALAAALLCGTAGTATILPVTSVQAADHVSRAVGEALQEAIKAAQAKDFATATAAVQKAEAVPGKTSFDTFQINQIKSFVAVGQQDYATATTAYEAVVAAPEFAGLSDDEKKQTLRNAMLLSGQAKHWAQVVNEASQLDKLSPLDEKGNLVLAQASYFTGAYATAQQAAQKSIDMAKAAGKEPEEAAYAIIMGSQSKSNDQAGALKTLELLAVNYGEAENWGQLIDHALATKGLSELDALYLYRLRFAVGASAASEDYTLAAGIALHQGYPAEAQNYLDKGLASGKISRSGNVNALLNKARDGVRQDKGSLNVFAKAAANSKAGEQDVKLAEDYYGYDRYADAAAAARSGIAKGGVKDPGEGHFILAAALLAQGKAAEAQQELAKVDGSPARANAAHLWDLYAQRKLKTASARAQ